MGRLVVREPRSSQGSVAIMSETRDLRCLVVALAIREVKAVVMKGVSRTWLCKDIGSKTRR